MINSIEVSNFKSIDYCNISFEKYKYKFLNDYNIDNKVANPIAVYGRNGSGKSSFIEVFRALIILLIDEPEQFEPFFPNFSCGKDKPSSIKILFDIDGNNYEYYVKTNIEKVIQEYLTKDNETILDRNDNTYRVNNKEYEIDSKLYLALRDIANKSSDSIYNRVYDYLSSISYIGADKQEYLAKTTNKVPYLDFMVSKTNEVKNILKEYKSFPIYDIQSYIDENNKKKQYYVSIENDDKPFVIPYNFVSGGMNNQSFMLSVLLSLPENGVMVVDELEDALHPLTIMNFINEAIKRKIQLIFVSHNTNTLSKLRPDNIIFAHWKNGYSTYKRLCDIYPNIREVNNIEKMYLSNVFDEGIEKRWTI